MKAVLKIYLLILAMLSISQSAFANADGDVAFILSAQKPPRGVVFEVVEGRETALLQALKKITDYSKQLKAKIPKIKLAVVSHGTEQFALLNENQKKFEKTHKKVQSLMSDEVPVHVCGTHASWYSLSEEDFPEYVDVTEAGPAKIREYQRQGYALIKIDIN